MQSPMCYIGYGCGIADTSLRFYGNAHPMGFRYMNMVKFRKFALCLAALLCFATNGTQAEDAPGAAAPFVVVCPIEGEIGDGVKVLVQRAVKEAEGASAIVFRIDTPGGRVDSAIEIATAIMEATCPTIAYIEGMGAISAGALISYACDHIIMAPATNIGASMPIMMGVETTEDINEKSMSFLRGKYRALGEENGHNPLIGEAMVDRDIELRGIKGEDGVWQIYKVADNAAVESYKDEKIINQVFETLEESTGEDLGPMKEAVEKVLGESVETPPAETTETTETEAPATDGATPAADTPTPDLANAEVISPAGKLLTFTGSEALEYGLAEHVVENMDEALAHYSFAEMRKHEIVPTWEELIFAWLTSPTIAGLLLMVGIGGIITEVRTPGFGVPGIVGGVCLFLFFGAHMVLGMADWIDIVLVLVGMLLIGIEIFVLPGFGVAGFSGIACLLLGVYLTLTKVTFPEYHWDFVRLEDAGRTVFTSAMASVVFGYLSWKLLPHTPFPGWLTLSTEQLAEGGYAVQGSRETEEYLGLRGVSTTPLRPAGRGRFGAQTLDVVTRGEFLEKGAAIEIIQVEGNRLVVTAAQEETET